MAETLALSGLAPPDWTGQLEAFEPCARYFESMDVLLYLEEDVPYRADRVDPFLTLLWHPSREEAIGVKLKGFRFLFQRVQAILRAQRNVTVADSEFLSLVTALEVAMTAGLGAVITADAERQRIEEKYAQARRLLTKETARFDATELSAA
jgi:hypothetical protein